MKKSVTTFADDTHTTHNTHTHDTQITTNSSTIYIIRKKKLIEYKGEEIEAIVK